MSCGLPPAWCMGRGPPDSREFASDKEIVEDRGCPSPSVIHVRQGIDCVFRCSVTVWRVLWASRRPFVHAFLHVSKRTSLHCWMLNEIHIRLDRLVSAWSFYFSLMLQVHWHTHCVHPVCAFNSGI